MGCRISDFDLKGKWRSTTIEGHKVELVEAQPKPVTHKGVVLEWSKNLTPGFLYKLDGKFQGFTGSEDAVHYHVTRKLAGEP